MKRISTILVVAAFFISSCASIVSKSDWPVKVASTPEQADISITDASDGRKIFSGKTPTTLTLSTNGGFFKGKSYLLQITKDGYETQSVTINSTMNPWYMGNVLFGGLIGILIVDPATGAMWTLDNKDVNLPLAKKIANSTDNQKPVNIVSLEDVPKDLRDKMIDVK